MRSSSTIRVVALGVLTGFTLCTTAPTSVHAQGGMGGMGGGIGGGRRGGMGGPGMGDGARRTPATMVKDNLEKNDPIAFLLDRKKPLTLSDAQKDSLKLFRKEMQRMQEPLFKDIEKIFADEAPQSGGGPGGGPGGGRRGGGMGGGKGAILPDTAKVIVARLTDIQEAYRDRARTQLNDGQRHIADSLLTALLDEERNKDEEERAKRRGRN